MTRVPNASQFTSLNVHTHAVVVRVLDQNVVCTVVRNAFALDLRCFRFEMTQFSVQKAAVEVTSRAMALHAG